MVPYKLALDAVESQKSSLNFKKFEKKSVKNWTGSKNDCAHKGLTRSQKVWKFGFFQFYVTFTY